MSIAQIFHWVQSTGWANAFRESEIVYPIVLSLHLTGIGFFGGAILMTNLRVLGLALKNSTVTDVVRQLRPWKWAGFILVVTCGVLLASAKADMYYPNPYFRIKILLLACVGVHALVFRRSVYRASSPVLPRNARLAACLSLALWLGILSMGRWIAYYEKPKKVSAPVTAFDRAGDRLRASYAARRATRNCSTASVLPPSPPTLPFRIRMLVGKELQVATTFLD